MKIVGTVFIISFGGYFLTQWIESIASNTIDYSIQTDNNISSFFLNFKTIITNKEGHIKHTIEGEQLLHSDNALSIIEKPLLQIHELNKIDWQVSSEQATILDTDNNIQFNTNVIAVNLSDTDDNMTLKTDELEFLTKQKIMRTKKEVRIETANSYTTAIGMITDNQKQQILLLEKVRSTYEN